MTVDIEESRKNILNDEFSKPYFPKIKEFLQWEINAWYTIYPKGKDIFNAFNLTPFDQVKVVILWQDPYHWEGEAHGLSFSVPAWIKIPPSLRNIFKELKSDLNIDPPESGNLEKWAKQWVLLLNAGLTVRKDTPNSHKDAWWHIFTDAVIKKLSDEKEGLVFILWWAFAQQKEALIDKDKHFIIKSAHPSPFSADRGFFWSRPFSTCNEMLESIGKEPIDWDLNH
jgi:uracil-DNA glycosylase